MTKLALVETPKTLAETTYNFPIITLSERERQIFDRIVLRGLTSEQIGTELHITRKTVESHRTHINKKLSCSSPYELLKGALVNGVIKVTDLTP